mgnify:CR=1 FL=1
MSQKRFTDEDMKACFMAGRNYEYAVNFGKIPSTAPTPEQFIESLYKPETVPALSPAKQEQPDHTIILSKLERTFGHLDKVFLTLREAHPHNTKALLDKVDIDFNDIQEQIKKALYDGPALPYTEEK